MHMTASSANPLRHNSVRVLLYILPCLLLYLCRIGRDMIAEVPSSVPRQLCIELSLFVASSEYRSD